MDHQRGEAERELVGKEHRRLARERASQREHLLLAAGEEPCSPAHQWLELGEQGRGVATWHAREAEVVGGGEPHEHRPLFGHEPQPATRALEQWCLGDRAVEIHLAGDRRQLARERQQGGGLPGTVRADQRHDLAGLDPEIEIADDRHRAVPGGQPATLEERGGRRLLNQCDESEDCRYVARSQGASICQSDIGEQPVATSKTGVLRPRRWVDGAKIGGSSRPGGAARTKGMALTIAATEVHDWES